MRDGQVADDRVERGFRERERLCIGLPELDPRASPPGYLDHRLRDIDSGDGRSAIRRLAGQVPRTTRNIEQPRVRSGADGVEKVIIEAVGKPGPVVVVRGGRGLPAGRLESVERVEISHFDLRQAQWAASGRAKCGPPDRPGQADNVPTRASAAILSPGPHAFTLD